MPLFAFGSNGSGQLGLGHTEDVAIPTRCVFDKEPLPLAAPNSNPGVVSGGKEKGEEQEEIVHIAAGGNHTLVLFANGQVYAAGCNVDGRCGQPSATTVGAEEGGEALLRFKRVIVVDEDQRIYGTFKNVSATWEATFLVAHDDDHNQDIIFVLGSGAKGELGLGNRQTQASVITTSTTARIPNFPPRGTQIISMASGMAHTAVALSTGEVYGWGGARKGQLGDAAKAGKVVWSPVRIEPFSASATDVTCGREFTVVSGDREKGEVVVLGACDDKWGILSGRPSASASGKGGALPAYASVSASWHGIYVHHQQQQQQQKNTPSITAWGRNDRGQLPPANLPNTQKLAVGSEHALALLDKRTVVAFGWGEHGNCGPETDAQGNVKGSYNKMQIPFEIGEGQGVVGVGAGCATSWIITEYSVENLG